MAQSVQDSIDALVQQHQGRQNRIDTIKQTVEGFHVYKASAAYLAKLCEQYEKLVYDILQGASDDFFGLIEKATGEVLVKGTATWEQALDEVQLRFYDYAAFDLRTQIEHATAIADYITKTHKTMLQTMTKFIGNTSSKLGDLGNLFREFQASHRDTFSIVPNAWMEEGKLHLALGADLTGLQKIRVTMARAARETNQARIDTPQNQLRPRTKIFSRDNRSPDMPGRFQSPPNQLPSQTMTSPRDNYQSPDIPGRFQSAPIDPISSLLREFEKVTLAPTPVAPITSLPGRTLATSIDKIASTEELCDNAIMLRGTEAGTFMDLLLTVLDQRAHTRDTRSSRVMKLLQDLSDESDSLPPSLYINNVTVRDAVNGGGEAQIRSGSYGGLDVAIRQFQQRQGMTKADWRKIIRREIIVHRYLRHENVLPLIGVFGDEAHPFNVVTPWMQHGVAGEYLKTRPDRFLDIARGSSAGLAYLHGCVPPVIHGDIHPENILVDSEGNARLCDFGLSRIQHEGKRARTKTHQGGYPPNMAPEITSAVAERVKITPQTDIYALAMTIYELGTRTPPLHQYAPDSEVQRAAESGERPEGPDTLENLSETEKRDIRTVWPLLELMWAQVPASRPSAVETFEELRGRNNLGVKMPPAHIHPMYAVYNENP